MNHKDRLGERFEAFGLVAKTLEKPAAETGE
jgi:hypothetical protein